MNYLRKRASSEPRHLPVRSMTANQTLQPTAPLRHAPPLLAALCLALATSPLAQAQDAISPPTLPEGPSKTATPTPAPEKPSLEILAGAPVHQEPVPVPGQTPSASEPVSPAPVPEQTPSATELATPALKAKQGTSVKRHTTPATKPEATKLPVADDLTPLSSAKAVAVRAPLPVYPYQAKHDTITGDGVCVMPVDTPSGKVTDATMDQSTGNVILDKTTTNAFRQWRFKPRTGAEGRRPDNHTNRKEKRNGTHQPYLCKTL